MFLKTTAVPITSFVFKFQESVYMAICLVTGGAGFIGSHLVERLVKIGNNVVVLDDLLTGKLDNLQSVANKIVFIKGDVRDLELVKRAVKGVDFVFHQAAMRSVPLSVINPAAFNEVNVSGTLNVLVAAREAKIKRFIFASSSSVYGDSRPLKKEEMKTQPVSPYAVSKAAGELYCSVFTNLYKVETVVLRYFNVFGPRQDPESQYAAVIPAFISKILANEQPIVYGDGLQSRDFTFVENVVMANIKAAENKGAAGKIFNIACGKRYTLLEILDRVNSFLGKEIKPKFLPSREGDVRHTLADIDLARQYLGTSSLVEFEEGLKQTIQWMDEASRVRMISSIGER
jgi:nucleoside-diphosphate-sugar epimerase